MDQWYECRCWTLNKILLPKRRPTRRRWEIQVQLSGIMVHSVLLLNTVCDFRLGYYINWLLQRLATQTWNSPCSDDLMMLQYSFWLSRFSMNLRNSITKWEDVPLEHCQILALQCQNIATTSIVLQAPSVHLVMSSRCISWCEHANHNIARTHCWLVSTPKKGVYMSNACWYVSVGS